MLRVLRIFLGEPLFVVIWFFLFLDFSIYYLSLFFFFLEEFSIVYPCFLTFWYKMMIQAYLILYPHSNNLYHFQPFL